MTEPFSRPPDWQAAVPDVRTVVPGWAWATWMSQKDALGHYLGLTIQWMGGQAAQLVLWSNEQGSLFITPILDNEGEWLPDARHHLQEAWLRLEDFREKGD